MKNPLTKYPLQILYSVTTLYNNKIKKIAMNMVNPNTLARTHTQRKKEEKRKSEIINPVTHD